MIPPPRQESGQARPAAPSGYLMAALLLVVLAPLALAGWLAGAAAIRSGWVSRRRLAAAATVTGALAFLLIGPTVAAGRLLSAVTTLAGVLPPATLRSPWKWALIHGAFVLGASVAYLVNWRLSERQAVEISRLVSRLEGLARTDPLTGVPNRRVWEEELPRELERARRMGIGVCVAMIDLDNFKSYNDIRIVERLRVVTPW